MRRAFDGRWLFGYEQVAKQIASIRLTRKGYQYGIVYRDSELFKRNECVVHLS